MLTSHGGGETGSHLRPDKMRLKLGAKGDCYPFPAGEADGAGVPRGSCRAAGGMGHHRHPAEDATHETPPHQCQQTACTSFQSCWEVGCGTAASGAVEFPCAAGGPLSRLRQLFVVGMGPEVSKGARPLLKVCCHPASLPVLALVPV